MNIYVVSFKKVKTIIVDEKNKDIYSFVTEGIVTDYISFQWNDKYYEEGSFNITLPANDDNMDLIIELSIEKNRTH